VTTVAELQKLVDKYVPKKMVPKDKKLKREELAQLVHDGIESKLEGYRTPIVERNDDPDFKPAEELITATGANVTYGSDEAAYLPLEDRIIMPNKRSFDTVSHYYEAHFHELAHWTEPEDRVGRKEGHKYAFGELVADMASCMVLTELGVPLADEMTENSKSYIKSWIKALEGGNEDASKFIFDAATQAGKVMEYLLAFVGKANPAYEADAA
jgi:antirestriction protein ArdC